MEKKCQDAVFGTMTYKHGWWKKETMTLFEKARPITISAAAYCEEPITQEERTSYQNFMAHIDQLTKTAERELKEYVHENLAELKEYDPNVDADRLENYVTPKTLLFQQDGTTLLLLECTWDIENGIAIKLLPEVAIGAQDLFL